MGPSYPYGSWLRPVVLPPMGAPVLGYRGFPPAPARFVSSQYSRAPAPASAEFSAAVTWLRDFVEGERRVLHDRIRLLESHSRFGEGRSLGGSSGNLRRELESVRRDFATSAALEEEHREKMDGYVKALMAEVEKLQSELAGITDKYSNVVRELEFSRTRQKELDKDKERETQMNEILKNKLNSKDLELGNLNSLVDRLQREKAKLKDDLDTLNRSMHARSSPAPSEEEVDLGLMFKVNRLEAIVREQNAKLIANERSKNTNASTEDVFACLRNPTFNAHTPRTPRTPASSTKEWLEPLELTGN